MKTWQERWFEELDAATPALTDDVLNAPLESAESSVSTRENDGEPKNVFQKLFATKKSRVIGIVSACAACLVGLGIVLPSILNPYMPPANSPVITAQANEAIVVEINPEAVFSVDGEGTVLSIVANNADADVILSSQAREDEMKGEKIEKAVEVFVDYAAQLGFLDYSVPDAIRISACGEENISKLNESLKTFFCEKGAMIAIIPETLTQETLCQRIGIEAQDGEKLVEALGNAPKLYARRQAEGKEDSELENIYRETVSVENLKAYYEEILNANIEKIEKNIADVRTLKAKSQEIYSHTDNPFAFLGGADYWTLRYLAYDDSPENKDDRDDKGTDKPRVENEGGALDEEGLLQFTEAFAALMADMDSLLRDYEKEYGVKIDGAFALEEAVSAANSLPLQALKELLNEFTVELLDENIEILTKILKNIGVDLSLTKDLYEPPKTKEEYFTKTEQFSADRFDKMKDGNASKYEENGKREKIDKKTYEDYISGIIAEYGSLEAYWESLSNI